MDTLLSAAHLKREIGDELFAALVSSNNTAAVREFAQQLAGSALPTEMTIAGRTYEILGFLRGDKKSVRSNVMVNRAKEMQSNLGQDDGEHLLAHQGEIPAALRGKVVFVFTDWRHPVSPECVCYVYWNVDRWIQDWRSLVNDWYGCFRVLRRKSAH